MLNASSCFRLALSNIFEDVFYALLTVGTLLRLRLSHLLKRMSQGT